MDKFKLVIEEAKPLNKVSFKSYDISVYLNDVQMPHRLFNMAEVMPLYQFNSVEFDLFTCSCGHAACAGYQSPIIHQKKEGIVQWTFSDDYTTEKKNYYFNEFDFNKELTDTIAKMVDLEKNNMINATLIREEESYMDGDVLVEEPYEKSNLKKALSWYKNKYQIQQNFQEMLEKEFPQYAHQKYRYVYEGLEGDYEHDLEGLICGLLREWPRKSKMKSFLNKAKKTGDIVIQLLNDDNKKFMKLLDKNYTEIDEGDLEDGEELGSVYDYIRFDFSTLEKAQFDLNKLKLIIINQS